MLPFSVTIGPPIGTCGVKDKGAGDRDDMAEGEVLRKLAEQKIVAFSGETLGAVGEGAADLLADLYAAGLAHGVSPQQWAAVTPLPSAWWDATVALNPTPAK